ncbi:MAG: hypothetical protein ACI9V8_001800, partial [Urechidicola sp.]
QMECKMTGAVVMDGFTLRQMSLNNGCVANPALFRERKYSIVFL